MPSPWVQRAQRNELPSKSHDIYAPSVEVANGIRFSAKIGTFTEVPHMERPLLCTCSQGHLDFEVAAGYPHAFLCPLAESQPCDGPEWFPEENQWMPCAVHGIGCKEEK